MKTVAITLYTYFPYGGLQRDCLRIAAALRQRGCQIRFYVMSWQGEQPTDMEVHFIKTSAWRNWKRNEQFADAIAADLKQRPVDVVVGFNRMPGLDFYFAADPCFAARLAERRFPFYHWSARYRHFLNAEAAVFGSAASTHVLQISVLEQPRFIAHYRTPPSRLHMLPPGIARDRCRPPDADQRRAEIRTQLGLDASTTLLLSVGSGFRIKGIDRSLHALAKLPLAQRQNIQFWVVGQDKSRPFQRLAKQLGLSEQVVFTGGRNDVPSLLLASDLLLHPAYQENTGTVLLEAIVAGLPVVCSARCGYASYVQDSGAGVVLPDPFRLDDYVKALSQLLHSDNERQQMAKNALKFSAQADIYDMPERAADLILSLPVLRHG